MLTRKTITNKVSKTETLMVKKMAENEKNELGFDCFSAVKFFPWRVNPKGKVFSKKFYNVCLSLCLSLNKISLILTALPFVY